MIYRVTIKTTTSRQPSGTYWSKEAVYCGTDLEEARVAYLREEASDRGGSYGNAARETIIQAFESEPEEIDSTEAEAVDA